MFKYRVFQVDKYPLIIKFLSFYMYILILGDISPQMIDSYSK